MDQILHDLASAVQPAFAAFLVALLLYGKNRMEKAARETEQRLEGSVRETVRNGVTDKLTELNKRLSDLDGRFEKVEVGVWQNTKRLQEIEGSNNGGSGQHFTPPVPPPGENRGNPNAIVPGTKPEN